MRLLQGHHSRDVRHLWGSVLLCQSLCRSISLFVCPSLSVSFSIGLSVYLFVSLCHSSVVLSSYSLLLLFIFLFCFFLFFNSLRMSQSRFFFVITFFQSIFPIISVFYHFLFYFYFQFNFFFHYLSSPQLYAPPATFYFSLNLIYLLRFIYTFAVSERTNQIFNCSDVFASITSLLSRSMSGTLCLNHSIWYFITKNN